MLKASYVIYIDHSKEWRRETQHARGKESARVHARQPAMLAEGAGGAAVPEWDAAEHQHHMQHASHLVIEAVLLAERAVELLPRDGATPIPAQAFQSSIVRDKNRCDRGKSQSIWTDFKMETPGALVDEPKHLVQLLVAELRALEPGLLTHGGRKLRVRGERMGLVITRTDWYSPTFL
jgi:hypothetical protein